MYRLFTLVLIPIEEEIKDTRSQGDVIERRIEKKYAV